MSSLELYTVSLQMARSGMFVQVGKASNKYGLIQIKAPSDRNIFVVAATITEGPSAFFQRSSSTFITEALQSPHPSSSGSISPGVLTSTGIGSSGRMSGGPIVDGDCVASNKSNSKDAVRVSFAAFPYVVPASEYFAMISSQDNEEITYGLSWVEIPIKH